MTAHHRPTPLFQRRPAVPRPSIMFSGALMGLALCGAAVPALAQTLKEPALEALYVADKPEALHRAALQRLAAAADDPQAVLALALAALQKDDNSGRMQALTQAQACAEKQPRSAPCQYAHGVLLGVQAMNEGMLKAARSIGTVKLALAAAHEAEPSWYPARSALMEFYLFAPSLMGGSVAKATELARSAPRPEQVQVLQARVALQDKQYEAAAAAFSALPALPALADHALAADALGWAEQAGLGLVNAGQPAKAQPLFERLMREHPAEAAGAYGLARVRGAMGDWAEALRLLEKAGTLKGAKDKPMAYRIGIAHQELGNADRAKAALSSFVAAGKGQKTSLEDARKRLAQLGS